jgi:hypothetical protein
MSGDIGVVESVMAYAASRDHNEADTRHKIIDTILHDVLAWPKNRVRLEEFVKPGFVDYVLTKPNGDPLIFIEAKRDGKFFTLPFPYAANETAAYISLKKLSTDQNISEAMSQVR